MKAIVILYKGGDIQNITKALIAKQLVNSGVDVTTIDMTTFEDSEVASLLTNAVNITNETQSTGRIKIIENETPLNHACTYIVGMFGETFENRRHISTHNFLINVLKTLNEGNDTTRTQIKNAFKIISSHEAKDVEERGIPGSIYKIIVELNKNNLV